MRTVNDRRGKLILYDIGNYTLTRDVTRYNTILKKWMTVRKPISEELKIGESAFIEDSVNKIKRISEDEYMFLRFDTISTHVKEYTESHSLDDIYKKIIKKLDYDKTYADERVKLVNELFEKNSWIYNLISTDKLIESHIKTTKDFLSEDTKYGQIIDIISSYLNHSKYKNEQDEEEKEKIMTKTQQEKNKTRETLCDSNLMTKDNKFNEFGDKDNNTKTKRRRIPKQKITDEDLKSIRELREMQQTINYLEMILGYKQGYKSKKVKEIHNKIAEEKGKKHLSILRSTYSSLNSEILIVKEKLKGTIYFKRFDRESTEYDFENDTGYFNENDEYILINQSKINLSKKEHITGLIKNYIELKAKYRDNFNHTMWAILWVLDDLIINAPLTDSERFIFEHYKGDSNLKTIVDKFQFQFGEETNIGYVSRVLNNYIPTKAHKYFLDSYDDWLYTYKKKGLFKKCSKCEEIKLISNDRYFSPKKDAKDRFHPYCRSCRS
jgi:hypothetical protein